MKKYYTIYIYLKILLVVVIIQSLEILASNKRLCEFHEEHSDSDLVGCKSEDDEQHLICIGGLHGKWESGSKTVRKLVLCKWPERILDPEEVLLKFPAVKRFSVLASNITKLSKVFPAEVQNLEKIALSGTKLEYLPKGAFLNLSTLKSLDLRNNSLREIDPNEIEIATLKHIYLSGNRWKCSINNQWILNSRNGSVASRVIDRDKLVCSTPFDGRQLLSVVEIIVTLKEECQRTNCDCELVYIAVRSGAKFNSQKRLMVFNSVNCSNRGITEMPTFLPANTTTLHLSGNNIADLTPLITNPVYKGVIDIYLDNNLIESIACLEGSYWLDHFRVLSLRGNRLSDLPTYALENALLQNANAAYIRLGNNPWSCDCLFTPGFQDLLIRYTSLVKDVNDVKCSSVVQDKNSNKQIRDLTRTAICIPPDSEYGLQPLDIMNIVMASLIFFILGKLLYDCWFFKRTGQLPWIVAKIP
ncbi:protein singed wings 2 isoform X2 [Cephus cinctus]|uniref:Protein singed wings 2 isoform X2 n=1 Tax=Cephus cinctus TaxID=211228 RepID=A0AAJ7FS12_CEPCN|nr:protein singed wings 2 isoform X2 [Cephus cinctus]